MRRTPTRRFITALAINLALVLTASAQNPTTSSYLYLSQFENTIFSEMIKFWYLDTLDGPVHSNDTIALQGGGFPGGPVFLDTVSTSAPIFLYFGVPTPFFAFPPVFNAPRVALPERAVAIRDTAAMQGHYFSDGNGQYAFRLVFTSLGWKLYRSQLGEPFQDSIAFAQGGVPNQTVIFVDGYLELKGLVRGTVTVGAHGCNNPNAAGYHCIRLIDDIRYVNSDPITGQFDSTCTDMLQIISESDVVIGNTPANGRDNGWNVYNHDPAYSSIIITAAVVALGEAFTFEDQNDTYIWEYSTGYVGPTPDRRGDIWLRGSLAQDRRGYVHRSNHGDTGYGKRYFYDSRFDSTWLPGSIMARHIPVLNPAAVNFGRVTVNQTATRRIALKNAGGTYIDLQTGHTQSNAFGVAPIDSLTLSPGDHTSFQVSFTPTTPNLYLDTLTIELQYGSDLKVPLRGVGLTGGMQIAGEDFSEVQMQPEDLKMELTPNPFNSQLHIDWGQNQLPANLIVRDVQGRVVEAARLEGGSYVWHPTGLAGGIYFVSLHTERGSLCRKVVYLK